jgi:hypothetical protein
MKLLLTSLVATAGVFLMASPAIVSAQTMIPGRPNHFTLPDGANFTCDALQSRCAVTGDFGAATNVAGWRLTSTIDGPSWAVLDETNNLITVGVCGTVDDCVVTCNFGCTCTQPDDTECPFIVAIRSPTPAPTKIPTQQETDALCEMFNAAGGGVLDCTCSRYDKSDTRISCDYVNTTCNADASICFNATVDIIVDIDAQSKSVTQCTHFIMESNETATNACITVYPAALGNYTELDSCCTTLNGDECNFCYISDTPDVTFSPIAVTYDCCNVVTDIKGTDNAVGANGAAIATFDTITAGEEGECKGNNNPPSGKSKGVCINFGGGDDDGGSPTQAPSMDKGVKTLNPTSSASPSVPDSGAGSWQSSTGFALVMATMVSAFVAGL